MMLKLMKIISILLFFTYSVKAQTNLIMPLATTHINVPFYYPELNENNVGIGIEHVDNGSVYSFIYVKENSFDKPSFYVAISRKTRFNKDFSTSVGLTTATGYGSVWEDPTRNKDKAVIILPILSVQWKFLRLATSYPFGALAKCNCPDFANLQYIYKF